jgi:hypothetical protein
MFSFQVRQQTIETSPEQSIGLTLSCPIFDPDRIGRVFSLPFKIPISPSNQRTLRSAHRFDAQSSWDVSAAKLFVAGNEYDDGEFLVVGSTDDAIEVMFRSLPLTVLDDLARIKMYEILETIEIEHTGPDPEIVLDVNAPPFAYQIRIGSIDYVLGIGSSSGMTHGEVCLYFQDEINADFPGMAQAGATTLSLDSALVDINNPNWSTMTGFTFNSYITVGQSAMIDFLNHVQAIAGTPVDSHIFPTMRWEGFYAGKNPLYSNIVNPYFAPDALGNEPNEEELAFQFTYIPLLKIGYLLNRITTTSGLSYMAGYVDDTEFQKVIVVNNCSVDKSYNNYQEDLTFKFLNGFRTEIDLNVHAPRMTALDFLKKLAAGLNLMIEYKDGGLWFTKILDIISKPPEDWTEHVDRKTFNYKIKKPEGLTLDYQEHAKEAYEKPIGQLDNYVVGAGGQPQALPFNTMVALATSLYEHGTFRCPHTDQAGQSPIAGGKTNDLPLCLLFDRGYGTTTVSEDYVYATYDEFADDATTVIGSLSLELGGELGLVAQNFGDTLLIPDASDLDAIVILPIQEVFRIREWLNARVKFYTPLGQVTAIIKSLDLSASYNTRTHVSGKVSLSIIR